MPTQRRQLHFQTVADVIADVTNLRAGYDRVGKWSLAQVAFHLDRSMTAAMRPGASATTPEQAARKPVLDRIMVSGEIPNGLTAPDDTAPPAECAEAAIDDFLSTAARFESFNGPYAPHYRFGVMPDADRRRHQLIHCAHHLSHLIPTK